MNSTGLVSFIRERGLAVVATCAADGAPEAALVGVAVTEEAELIFDTTRASRKYRNLQASPRVAVVVGWDDEVTVQCEGVADTPTGEDAERCRQAYFDQFPDGIERAQDPQIVHVRIRPTWLRFSDFRPDTFGVEEITLTTGP
jgi:PPOX class probable F420-dependent enzyme